MRTPHLFHLQIRTPRLDIFKVGIFVNPILLNSESISMFTNDPI